LPVTIGRSWRIEKVPLPRVEREGIFNGKVGEEFEEYTGKKERTFSSRRKEEVSWK